jgi:hypothetical protein
MEQFLTGMNIHVVLEIPLKKFYRLRLEIKQNDPMNIIIFTNVSLPRYSLGFFFLGFNDEACSTGDGIFSFHNV